MSVTNLIKNLLVLLFLVAIAQSTAEAGNKRFRIQAGGVISIDRPFHKPRLLYKQKNRRIRLTQNRGRRISPSAALRAAMRVAPGSKGLGVRYLRNRRGYVVVLKTRGRIRRVFVDARTGRVRR